MLQISLYMNGCHFMPLSHYHGVINKAVRRKLRLGNSFKIVQKPASMCDKYLFNSPYHGISPYKKASIHSEGPTEAIDLIADYGETVINSPGVAKLFNLYFPNATMAVIKYIEKIYEEIYK